MQYLLMICGVEDAEPVPGVDMAAAGEAWAKEMDGRGVRIQGNRLRPIADATTVRVRETEVLVSDGPFAETKEQIAGLNVLDCADLDEAIQVASQHPTAKIGTFELRPLWSP